MQSSTLYIVLNVPCMGLKLYIVLNVHTWDWSFILSWMFSHGTEALYCPRCSCMGLKPYIALDVHAWDWSFILSWMFTHGTEALYCPGCSHMGLKLYIVLDVHTWDWSFILFWMFMQWVYCSCHTVLAKHFEVFLCLNSLGLTQRVCISYLGHKTSDWVKSQISLLSDPQEPLLANCQELESRMILACHAPWQPLQRHSAGHLGGLTTRQLAEKMLDEQWQRVDILAQCQNYRDGLPQKKIGGGCLLNCLSCPPSDSTGQGIELKSLGFMCMCSMLSRWRGWGLGLEASAGMGWGWGPLMQRIWSDRGRSSLLHLNIFAVYYELFDKLYSCALCPFLLHLLSFMHNNTEDSRLLAVTSWQAELSLFAVSSTLFTVVSMY